MATRQGHKMPDVNNTHIGLLKTCPLIIENTSPFNISHNYLNIIYDTTLHSFNVFCFVTHFQLSEENLYNYREAINSISKYLSPFNITATIKYHVDNAIINTYNKEINTLDSTLEFINKNFITKITQLVGEHESFQHDLPGLPLRLVRNFEEHLLGLKGNKNE